MTTYNSSLTNIFSESLPKPNELLLPITTKKREKSERDFAREASKYDDDRRRK